MLTAAQKDRLFRDPEYGGYFEGSDFLEGQPPSLAPDDYYEQFEKWNDARVRRALFDLHVDFLESLFDKNGFAVLYRATEKRPKVRPGDVANLGKFWTYSGDADLSHAQVASGARYTTGFAALVHESQVDWRQTIADHTGRWDGEKQIFVKGPVQILDVFPISEWDDKTERKYFDKWARGKFSHR